MKLPSAPAPYNASAMSRAFQTIELADARNVKKGSPQRLLMQSPDGTVWEASIDNAGVLTWTAL